MSVPFIVGAYASLPTALPEQEEYYATLGAQSWVNGLEIPFRNSITDDPAWFAAQLPDHFHINVLTPIPGTMQRVGADPAFGLASPDDAGQAAALDFLLNASWAIKEVNDAAGRQIFTHVELHSAPTGNAHLDPFLHSLDIISQWDWDGAQLVIEHQDEFIPGQLAQKGFLSLADEIKAATERNMPIVINWGRSVIEGRSTDTPLAHVQQAGAAGVLGGVIFSGSHSEANSFGPAWNDDHMPLHDDEPSSLMTVQNVTDVANATRQYPVNFLGAKVSIRPEVSLSTRLDMIRRIAAAAQVETGSQIG
ncbi:DUF4862 family protein [Arcanobacterium phocae]|nr:DUF4862 family protein [Arcanobacterium phocae]